MIQNTLGALSRTRVWLIATVFALGCANSITHGAIRDEENITPHAGELVSLHASGLGNRTVTLSPGRSAVVDVGRDAKEVFVVSPKVAKVISAPGSKRRFYVIGVDSGSTTIFVSDPDNQPIATLTVLVTRDLDPLRRALIENIPSGGNIKVAAVGPNVILTGSVANISDMQRAVDLGKAFLVAGSPGEIINGLTVREKDQVMIKVSIAEVKRAVLKRFGINLTGMWQVANNAFGFVNNPSVATANGGQLNGVDTNRQDVPGTGVTAGTPFGQINAFESAGVVRVLAEPTLSAVSGESAEFLAGGEVPVQTSQITNGSATFSTVYQPYGIRLKFKPLVLGQGRISLGVATEVRDIDSSRPTVDGNPSFLTRSVATVVELPSGGALVMAGLLQENIQQTIVGLPGVMNVPVLGALFRSRDFQRSETELVISVVPYIAKPVMPEAITYPGDGFVDSSDPQTIFLGQINQTYNSKAPVGMPSRKLPSYRGDVGFITTH